MLPQSGPQSPPLPRHTDPQGLVKKGEPFPTHLPKADLRACFLARCQSQCRISRGAEQV